MSLSDRKSARAFSPASGPTFRHATPPRPQAPGPDKAINTVQNIVTTSQRYTEAQSARAHRNKPAKAQRPPLLLRVRGARIMEAAVQFLGVASPAALAPSPTSRCTTKKQTCSVRAKQQRGGRLRARAVEVGAPGGEPASAAAPEEEPSIDFAFVAPRLLPDGTPDVQYRSARGGQKLRDIMLQGYIDLYGPYDQVLLNCAGGGVCGTCIVEVVAGKEMLSPKTDVEKEVLKKKPKTWRLACQTTVGNPDSTGQMIVQQLPDWKVHEWDKMT